MAPLDTTGVAIEQQAVNLHDPVNSFVIGAQVRAVITELPTYGCRRVHALLKRQALAADLKAPNRPDRVYDQPYGSR